MNLHPTILPIRREELRTADERKLSILVSGASGLVGQALVSRLASRGHRVARLVRSRALKELGEVRWNPRSGFIEPHAVVGYDAVIHLAGENIASGRWTDGKKARIYRSRVEGTRLLAEAAASAPVPPRVFLSASAIGFYGDSGSAIVNEQSPRGEGFLAETCEHWEQATDPARQAGSRVVNLRFGLVLSRDGGVLRTMLPPFRMGLGGRVGDGRQYYSWIALPDAIEVILHALEERSLHGPLNVVTPYAVTSAQFTRALGRALKRPTPFPIPAFAARLAFGEMADALLLASTRVDPTKLRHLRFPFRYAHLDEALEHLLAGQKAERSSDAQPAHNADGSKENRVAAG